MPDSVDFVEEPEDVQFVADEDALKAAVQIPQAVTSTLTRAFEAGAPGSEMAREQTRPARSILRAMEVAALPPGASEGEMAAETGTPITEPFTAGPGFAAQTAAIPLREAIKTGQQTFERAHQIPPPFVISTGGEQPELRQMTREEERQRIAPEGQPAFQFQRTALRPEGTPAQRLIENFLATPENITLLAAGGAGPVSALTILGTQIPGIVGDIKNVIAGNETQEVKEDRIRNLLMLGVLASKGSVRAPGEVTPRLRGVTPPPEAPPLTMETAEQTQPLTLTGAAIPGRPRGAFPPMPAVAGREVLGPPAPVRPEVPATAPEAERGMSVIEEIRRRNLRTNKQIREAFPDYAGEVADLRRQAWGGAPDTGVRVAPTIPRPTSMPELGITPPSQGPPAPTVQEAGAMESMRQARELEDQRARQQSAIAQQIITWERELEFAQNRGDQRAVDQASQKLLDLRKQYEGPPMPSRQIVPKPPIPRAPGAKFRPEVPGTPAEERETVLETIRKNNARTRSQIQGLFPERGLSREEAADLRDQAWGKQPPGEPPAAPPAAPPPEPPPTQPPGPPPAGPAPSITPPSPAGEGAPVPEVASMGPATAGGKDPFGNPLGTKYHATPEDWAKWQELQARIEKAKAAKDFNAMPAFGKEVEAIKAKYAGSIPMPPKEPIAPKATAATLTPDDLQPALLVNGKPVTGGTDHEQIFRNATAAEEDSERVADIVDAQADDSKHVFVDKAGNVYTRDQAAKALGEKDPLQSARLRELQQKAAPAPAPEALPAAPEAPAAPTGIEGTVIAGKTLAEWEAVKTAADLPKGTARAELAKWLAVPNQPSRILQALANKKRTREIHGPMVEVAPVAPEAPEAAAAPATPAPVETKAPAPETKPAEPETKVAQAETKAQKEVSKVASAKGQRAAKEVKSELIQRIETAMKGAPEKSDYNKAKHGTVTIRIPGDGDFKIPNHLEALSNIRTAAQKISTSTAARTAKLPESGKFDYKAEAKAVIDRYGSAWDVAAAIERQVKALGSDLDETQQKHYAKMVDAVVRAGQESRNALLGKRTEYEKAIDRTESRIDELRGQSQKAAEAQLTKWRNGLKEVNDTLDEDYAKMQAYTAPESESPPSKGPGAAAKAEFAERPPDPEVLGLSAGNPIYNRIERGFKNLFSGLSQLGKRKATKQDFMQWINAADNMPRQAGLEAGNSLRERATVPQQQAVTALMQAFKMSGMGLEPARVAEMEFGGNPAGWLRTVVSDMETKAQEFLGRNLKLEAQAAIDMRNAARYALDHFNELRPLAELAKRKFDLQHARLGNAGVDVNYENWYVPQRHELDLFSGQDRPVVLGHSRGAGAATGFKKAKTYPNYAEAIENGFVPRSLAIGDLLEHYVATTEKVLTYKGLFNSLGEVPDPVDGNPLATKIPRRVIERPDGTTDIQEHVPLGYVAMEVGPGMRLAIHRGYERLIRALTSSSQLSESAVVGTLQDLAAIEKHMMLALDTFHASRTLQAELALTHAASLPGTERLARGLALVELSPQDLDQAVRNGRITQEIADWIRTPSPVEVGGRQVSLSPRNIFRLGLQSGLNITRFADVMYRDWLREVPVLGTVNRWVFDKMTRSAMSQAFIAEFIRNAKANPGLNAKRVALKTASDINVMFGNLQKESIFRNPSMRAINNIVFLAPQWVESLARREGRFVRQIGETAVRAARGEGVTLGTVGRGIGTGLAAYFVATQLANLMTRGHLTFQNPEEGHKLDAWLPIGPHGMFVSPLSVFGEVTHDILRFAETKPDYFQVGTQILSNKLGNLGRFLEVVATGRDPLSGEKVVGTARRAIKAATQLVPIPITASGAIRSAASATGLVQPPAPGALPRQLMGSLGVKTEPGPSAQQQVRQKAERWALSHGGKIQADAERRLKEDFGPSDYSTLRASLNRNDLAGARRAYQELRQAGKTPTTIRQTMEHPHPFTGSAANESQFQRTLTPEEKELYRAAVAERRELARRFHHMLQQTK